MPKMVEWLLNSFSDLNLELRTIEEEFVQTLAIIIALGLLRWLIILIVNYETKNPQIRYWWRKASTYLVVILGVLLLWRIWIGAAQATATFLGLFSAGLAIALQGPITDIAGWLFLLIRRPFEVGDRVQIGQHAGDVIDIRLFQFSLLEIGNWVDADQSTGRILDVPNRKIFNEVLANYTQGFEYIWNEIPVLITFESDWEQAKRLLQEIVDRHAGDTSQAAALQVQRASRRYLIRYSKFTPIVYTKKSTSGVLLSIRYLCQARRRRSSEEEIWEDVLRTLSQYPTIKFAYPTQRFYYNQLDGQPPAGFRPDVNSLSADETAD